MSEDNKEKKTKRPYVRKKPFVSRAMEPIVPRPKRRRGALPGEQTQRPFVATDEQRETVTTLVACGVLHRIIAIELGISEETLYNHFKPELEDGQQRANGRVASLVYNDAIAGRGTYRMFWLKCRAGWREGTIHEHTGPDGKPIQLESRNKHKVDWSKLPLEERLLIEAAMLKLEAQAAADEEEFPDG